MEEQEGCTGGCSKRTDRVNFMKDPQTYSMMKRGPEDRD